MRAISMEPEGGHNLFMVGDVKQSIYRFRLARPELFMDKYASFSTEESLQQRIDLHMNFRSRAQVLDFCNDIFYKIMSPDLGRVAYDRDAALYYGAKNYDENAKGFKPELLLLDEKDELLSETKNLTKGQMEAHMIATRIADMKQHMQVTDKESGQLRPLRYSDIVILLRSLKDYGTDFVQVLQGAGIPAYVESSTGYFSASEVQTVLAMLRILDNPYQDIPMAAVLRSPLVGLDEEEMAQIRVENPECSFAEAAMHAMQDATEGALYDFYRMYRKLREKQDLPIHELIQKILQLSGYGNYAAALPAGERRAANLAMLVEKAVDYEKTSYRGLFHFLRYIDKLQKYEVDFGEADTTGENANVVRVMTIHKSKGLEFPVVFVSGLGRKMNQMDASDRLVVHPDLGLGICEIFRAAKSEKKQCVPVRDCGPDPQGKSWRGTARIVCSTDESQRKTGFDRNDQRCPKNVFRIYRKCTSGEAGQLPARGPGQPVTWTGFFRPCFLIRRNIRSMWFHRKKLYGKRWNRRQTAGKIMRNFCSISIMRNRNCFSSMTSGFPTVTHIRVRPAKKVNIRFRN